MPSVPASNKTVWSEVIEMMDSEGNLPCFIDRLTTTFTAENKDEDGDYYGYSDREAHDMKEFKEQIKKYPYTPLVLVSITAEELKYSKLARQVEHLPCLFTWKGHNPKHNYHKVVLKIFRTGVPIRKKRASNTSK